MIEIHRAKDKKEMDLVHEIRREVFIKEQGVPEELEMDELDQDAVHVLAYVDGIPAGCGRMIFNGVEAKIGRVAVRKDMRRTGIGTGICKLLIAIAKDSCIQSIYVNAQITAVDFYSSLGFEREGDAFFEAGIKHVKMVKSLHHPY
jgi:predicted GNAT family N-acyltransferase